MWRVVESIEFSKFLSTRPANCTLEKRAEIFSNDRRASTEEDGVHEALGRAANSLEVEGQEREGE